MGHDLHVILDFAQGILYKKTLFFPPYFDSINSSCSPSNCWLKKTIIKELEANQKALVVCSPIFPA